METLVYQWLDYRGYYVRSNVNVGRLQRGGHAGEIDVAALHIGTKHCLHVECSCDADAWEKRQKRFDPKFRKGKEFIKEIFPFDVGDIEQWALVWSAASRRRRLDCGAKVVTLRTLYQNIAKDVRNLQSQGNRTFPEKYFLLRAVQDTMKYVTDSRRRGGIAIEDLLSQC